MLDELRCRAAVREAFPSLDVRSASYFAAGWDYEMWEVNGELLFRFPLRPECAEALRVEAELLSDLAVRLSVPVPRPECMSDGVEAFRWPFFGYRRLPGVSLVDATLSDEALTNVGRQLGGFLRELHSFPVKRAQVFRLPMYTADGWRQFYCEFRTKCDQRIGSLLAPDEKQRLDAFWTNFLDDDNNFRFRPLLVHADLGPDHILVDPERGTLSGVIDFADARVGDPAIDLVALLRISGPVLDGYGAGTTA